VVVAVSDAQVRKLMREMDKDGHIGVAAHKANMDRKTARKYLREGKLPSELKQPRSWRTRPDPFEEDWPAVEAMLRDAPELEGKALFEHLSEVLRPGHYEEGQLRTFQRRVQQWRALHGPDKEVMFPQEHQPGVLSQTDFTCCNELLVTIGGEPFPHLLCHVVLVYSNWEWATVCRSESMAAMRRGVQAAFFRLGRVTVRHQTDNSTAATHDLRTGKRGFNEEYEALMKHLGMTPCTIGVGKSNQNGDVESSHNALKRRLAQHLLLRCSRDFESVAAYETFLEGVLVRANERRQSRLASELAVMRALEVERLPEFVELRVPVTSWSTIRVKHNAYSVPSRLIGETVSVRLYEDRLEVYYAEKLQMTVGRLLGRMGHRVSYRHIIWSLVRKPGAFAQYRYREDLFPSVTFRRAYDALREQKSERAADVEYLRILHLAASTLESEVEAALDCLLQDGQVPEAQAVKDLIGHDQPRVPRLAESAVDLGEYDLLLKGAGEVAR
jgi:transposase InsO family protein